MRSLVKFLGGLRIRSLSPLMVVVPMFVLVFGTTRLAAAQASRYTIDDVMNRLIEMDKRLTVVETEVKRNRELIETVNANLSRQIETVNANLSRQIETINTNLGDRISDTNTTMLWLFGFLGSLFLGILALTFANYRNTASLVRAPSAGSTSNEAKLLVTLREEVKELSAREKALEEKLTAAKII